MIVMAVLVSSVVVLTSMGAATSWMCATDFMRLYARYHAVTSVCGRLMRLFRGYHTRSMHRYPRDPGLICDSASSILV